MNEEPENERWIPTPEEVEEGRERRRGKEPARPDGAPGEGESLPRRLARRFGVGRGRRYIQPDEQPMQVTTAAGAEEEPLEAVAAAEEELETKGVTVETVKIRRRRKAAVRPTIDPHSKEGRFYARASEKGHEMGPLTSVPLSDNLEAICGVCGLKGVLIVEREDYGVATWDFQRGPAMDQSCARAGESS